MNKKIHLPYLDDIVLFGAIYRVLMSLCVFVSLALFNIAGSNSNFKDKDINASNLLYNLLFSSLRGRLVHRLGLDWLGLNLVPCLFHLILVLDGIANTGPTKNTSLGGDY